MLNTNFDEVVRINGTQLDVMGTTADVPDGYELLSRYFTLQQGPIMDRARAAKTGAGNWGAATDNERINVGKFEAGPAVAVGIETYLVESPTSPSFVTFTWTQEVTIKEANGP